MISQRFTFGRVLTASSLAMALLASAPAHAEFPNDKPIRLVVGYPPGGSVDLVGRAFGEALGKKLGANVVVENMGGAAGSIGAQRAVSATPDGYTVLVAFSSELVATKLLYPSQKYDATTDLTPIAYIGSQPLVLVASKASGVTSLQQFLDATKKAPGKYNYGSSGVGTLLHLSGEELKMRTGIKIEHVPYRGVAPLTSDLLGGTLDFGVYAISSAQTLVDSDRITPLGVTGAKRAKTMPQVPAIAEYAGLSDYELFGWYAFLTPKGIAQDVQTKLEAAAAEAMRDPALLEKLATAGIEPSAQKVDVIELMKSDTAKYKRVIDFAQISAQ